MLSFFTTLDKSINRYFEGYQVRRFVVLFVLPEKTTPSARKENQGNQENDGHLIIRIDSSYGISHYFPTVAPSGCIHVLVKIANELPLSKRRKTDELTGADFWKQYKLESVNVDPNEYDLDNLDTEIGSLVPMPGLVAFWEGYGGFPPSYYVRREEVRVWKIIEEAINTKAYKAVLRGSPGVGKSTLLAIATFYMAFVRKRKVLVVRQLKLPGLRNSVVYLTPDGQVYRGADVPDIGAFVNGRFRDTIVFVDGYTQEELVTQCGGVLQSYNFLATSCQFDAKSNDFTQSVLLPAWTWKDLLSYAKESDWVIQVQLRETKKIEEKTWPKLVKEHYYYSGGSLREFCLTLSLIKQRVTFACGALKKDGAFEVVYNAVGPRSNAQRDRLCRHYVISPDAESSYTDPSTWDAVVDSGYTLKLLGSQVTLGSRVKLYTYAAAIGGGFQGVAFEQLVHRVIGQSVTSPGNCRQLPRKLAWRQT